jgi:methyl-accepting chemotaxis protein-1 (serine sensor receptor)
LHQQTQQLKAAVSVFEISDVVLRMQHFDELRGEHEREFSFGAAV